MMLTASLVWDGDNIIVPPEMGTPTPTQLKGTIYEQLSELACRVCYDSLGAGRTSKALHEHILEVGHTSVYEHPTITIELISQDIYWRVFANRPGIWLEQKPNNRLQITYNLRTALEWDKYSTKTNTPGHPHKMGPAAYIRSVIRKYANNIAPQIVKAAKEEYLEDITPANTLTYGKDSKGPWTMLDEPLHRLVPINEYGPHQAWISLYMSGSRGFSHEQVRHGNETAISQRSTRYVDESDCEIIEHPAITAYMTTDHKPILHPLIAAYMIDPEYAHREWDKSPQAWLKSLIDHSIQTDKTTYKCLVDELQAYLVHKGADKFTARKQARGAARGYLPNALQTELIFSASANQWAWMLKQRCSQYADAEIRVLYAPVLAALKSSRYAHMFNNYTLKPSPDGIGQIIHENI